MVNAVLIQITDNTKPENPTNRILAGALCLAKASGALPMGNR
ncbi:hypothetical protein [Treponema vincentii]|nr:hypothetical protein [Treponema vincentii]